MKSFLIFLILIIVVFTFLVVTNPTKEEFISWGIQKMQAESETNFEKILEGIVGEQVLEAKTTRKSYLIFSIYSVASGEESIKYIGIIKNFFQLGS